MTTQLFGAPIKRKEDPRLVTGRGRYLDDLGHDALAAAFVRSPHAHARILDIDATDAIDVEGVVGIYVHEDLPGRVGEPLPLLIPHPTLTQGRTGHALARDEVNHVGEPVVMVVASDRYVAEDACQRIRVTYEQLPPVVGIEAARAGELLVHDDVPGNVAAHMLQEVGDVEAALATAPHTMTLELDIERSASTPMEGRGVYARWDDERGELRLWSSTQTSTGVRAAVAAKLDLPLEKVECIAPDVGGGFGVKIVHPWPEEVLVPWAARLLGRPVKFTEDRREHFVSAAHERGQLQTVTVGFDDDARLLALDVKLWHDNGAYTPYGIIVPIITSTQLLGPYKPGTYRCEFWSLYTNTVLVTPYRGAGRPQGCFAMERVMDAIADELALDRTEVRARNFILPSEMPWDHGLLFQDGRPLKYDSGDFPASLAKIKALVGWDDFTAYREAAEAEGRRVGIGIGCYVEGTGVGPYEGGHVQVETSGRVNVSTGLTSQGQGHETVFAQIVGDGARRASRGRPRDDGRHAQDGVCRGHVRLAGRGHERERHRSRSARCPRQGAARRRRRSRGVACGPRDRRGHGACQGRSRHVDVARHGLGAVQPAALRVRPRGPGGNAVRRHVRPGEAAGGRSARSPASRAGTSTPRPRRPSPTACTPRSSRPTP